MCYRRSISPRGCSLTELHPSRNRVSRKSSFQNNRRRPQNRQNSSSSYSLTNRARVSLHTGFPARYTTSIKTEMQCVIPAAAATFASGNYFAVLVNSIYSPFATTYNFTTGTGTAAYAFAGNLVNGYTITNSPMYYVELATLYGNYRVLKYSLKVTSRSTSTGDVFSVSIFPLGNQIIPSTSASAVNMRVFGSQPRSKQIEIATGVDRGTLTLSQNVWDLLEIRKSQWMDLPNTQVAQTPVGTGTESCLGYVGCFLQMLAGVNNAGGISVTAELTQEVEFTDLIQPIL